MSELTPRQQKILGLVVRMYIDTAAPVGSKVLMEASDLGVSSATIRNEMAVLEELGYLTHPHTSAGRVPTDKGYRYFVERLIDDVELPPAEKNTIRHQFHQARMEMSQWMQLAAAVLARVSRSASLVTAPRLERPRLRHIELISTQSHLVLMIVVFQGGSVRQRMLSLQEPISQQELSQIAARFNEQAAGMDAEAVRQHFADLAGFEREVLHILLDLMTDAGQAYIGEVYRDGLTEVLQEPEFNRSSDVNALVNVLEQPGFLGDVLSAPVGTVQVIIGGEGRWRELSACSVVIARYGAEGFATGALGVLGPTRMPYGRAIGAVRYVADIMSDLVNELYGESS